MFKFRVPLNVTSIEYPSQLLSVKHRQLADELSEFVKVARPAGRGARDCPGAPAARPLILANYASWSRPCGPAYASQILRPLFCDPLTTDLFLSQIKICENK